MNICRKKLVINIVLFLGMLLCYNICFQQSNTSLLVELSSENSLSSNFVDFDYDINEEYQISYGMKFFLLLQKDNQCNHFHYISKTSQPFYSIWQPPKLS